MSRFKETRSIIFGYIAIPKKKTKILQIWAKVRLPVHKTLLQTFLPMHNEPLHKRDITLSDLDICTSYTIFGYESYGLKNECMKNSLVITQNIQEWVTEIETFLWRKKEWEVHRGHYFTTMIKSHEPTIVRPLVKNYGVSKMIPYLPTNILSWPVLWMLVEYTRYIVTDESQFNIHSNNNSYVISIFLYWFINPNSHRETWTISCINYSRENIRESGFFVKGSKWICS